MSSFQRHTKGGQALLVYFERLSKYSDYIWSGFETWFNSLLMLGATIVISRNIGASEVGAFAVIQLVVIFFQIITTLGVADSIVRESSIEGKYLPTIFWVAITASACAVVGIYTFGPFLLTAISGEEYIYPLYVLSFSMIFHAWTAVLLGLQQRSMAFRGIAMARVASMLISVLVSVSMALTGAGIWSFVALSLLNYLSMTIFLTYSTKWFPVFSYSHEMARSMFCFNISVMGSNLLSFLSRRGDYLLVGRLVGVEALGYYSICGRISFVLLDSIVGVVMRVAYPKVNSIIRSELIPRDYWFSLHAVVILIVAPVFMYLACFSGGVLLVCFDDTWSDYGYVLSALSGISFLGAIRYVNGMYCRAYGKPVYMLWLNGVYVICGLIAVMFFFTEGLYSICMSWLILGFLITPITFLFVYRVSGIRFILEDLHCLIRIVLAFLCISISLIMLKLFFADSSIDKPVLELLLGYLLLALYYICTLRSKVFTRLFQGILGKSVP